MIAINTFGYRIIYSQGYKAVVWQVHIDNIDLEGTSNSVRKAYREARRAVKRYRKMHKFLNKKITTPLIPDSPPLADGFILPDEPVPFVDGRSKADHPEFDDKS